MKGRDINTKIKIKATNRGAIKRERQRDKEENPSVYKKGKKKRVKGRRDKDNKKMYEGKISTIRRLLNVQATQWLPQSYATTNFSIVSKTFMLEQDSNISKT